MCGSIASSHPVLKSENNDSASGSNKVLAEAWTKKLTVIDIMIQAGDKKVDDIWVKLKNQKKVEIVPLLSQDGLSHL